MGALNAVDHTVLVQSAGLSITLFLTASHKIPGVNVQYIELYMRRDRCMMGGEEEIRTAKNFKELKADRQTEVWVNFKSRFPV